MSQQDKQRRWAQVPPVSTFGNQSNIDDDDDDYVEINSLKKPKTSKDKTRSNKVGEVDSYAKNMIRVGRDYQAECPPLQSREGAKSSKYVDHDVLLWRDDAKIKDADVENFVAYAHEHHNYSREQAYGMLFWHDYNTRTAKIDLPMFTPVSEEWSQQEKDAFNMAYSEHGKCFRKYKQAFPEKTIAQCVLQYYLYKFKGVKYVTTENNRIITVHRNNVNGRETVKKYGKIRNRHMRRAS